MTINLIEPFIERWQASGAAERANYQLFLSELCDVLGPFKDNEPKKELAKRPTSSKPLPPWARQKK